MKVVHVGDSAGGGGAANAMSRLHEALQRVGVDSRVLVRNGSVSPNAVETIATRGDADDLFPAVRDAVVRQYVELNRTGLTNTHFSLHVDGADLSRVPLVASSDIVHLHWTASFQMPADVRALLDVKPVVWTLHDLEPLTGGCHFPAGCEGYVDDCAGCPQLVRDPFRITTATLHDKKTLWAGARPTFIAPSRYMAERARVSAVARHAEASIVHIPHGIDVEAFRPLSKAAARSRLGVPPNGLYVLCGSNHNSEMRKGLRFLDAVFAAATADSRLDPSQLKILTVGEPKLDLRVRAGIDVIELGRVSLDLMPSVYAAADVFLHPSVEDNFPCMLLESLSCGTPAIAFDAGGVGDIVRDGVCGHLVAAGDALGMADALSSLAGDRERLRRMSETARAHIEKNFDDRSIARKHAELYDDVAKGSAALRSPSGPARTSRIDEMFPRWSTACLVQELALARDRAAGLVEESRAKSEQIALLEGEAAGLTLSSTAIHAVAEERGALAETLHASAASIEAIAANLQREVRKRDDQLAKRDATIEEQRVEIELVHRVAAERRLLIEDLNRVAEERKNLAESLHASAARIEARAANLQRDVRERDDLLAKLEATTRELQAEIDLLQRVAADRPESAELAHRPGER